MPRFEPFIGIRYDTTSLDPALVTAPPYDVISPSDRAALIANAPANVVRIDLPVDGDDPYGDAAQQFNRWRTEGVFVDDSEPSFTVYRMEAADENGIIRHTTGVIGAMELTRPGEGDILPHEFTTPKAKSDRLDLLRSTRSNLSAVWGLSPASGLTALLDTTDAPLCRFEADGVTHTIWKIADPERISAIRSAIGSAPIVIADGHHRYETSLAYRDERRAADGDGGAADAVMTFVVELVEDELEVGPIHRLISGLPDDVDLLAAFDPYFESEPFSSSELPTIRELQELGGLALVTSDGTWLLRPRPDTIAATRDLDSSRLDLALTALPDHSLVYQHGVDHIDAAVRSGAAQAGVLLRPVRIDQIIEIAEGGEKMPPKSTFFAPKPRTGVVFRSID
ncbi:MAG: DUF1015 family protein [Actinobacteria bacterium]|uniref:Unannotated protein n=1 Tax=freshwater metagenome TaxID=449393 RepID=A0A6J7VGK1_9ZZZZ|nr:DUF1015 family protein [Actinomycetota bacterium]MTA44708.1 DUF1015 family protein [Actinomycetota bacterium]